MATGRHPTERLPEAQVEEVVRAVSYAGFQYIPVAALDEPYTGPHPAFAGATWWRRFLDYIYRRPGTSVVSATRTRSATTEAAGPSADQVVVEVAPRWV